MSKPIAALAVLFLAAPAPLSAPAPGPAPASSPTRDEALRCWLMVHPNRAPLPVTHWPQMRPRGERIA